MHALPIDAICYQMASLWQSWMSLVGVFPWLHNIFLKYVHGWRSLQTHMHTHKHTHMHTPTTHIHLHTQARAYTLTTQYTYIFWVSLHKLFKMLSLGHKYPGGGGGVLRGVRHTGMCRSNRSLFWEKIPKHRVWIWAGKSLNIPPPPPPHFCNFTVDTRYFCPFCR